MTSNLAIQLREGTSKSHTMAENVNFIKSFLGGVIDKGSYTEMLSKLYFVYEAIENAMEKNKDHDYIKPIYFPELNRTESLKEDLRFHYGDNWLENTQPSKATLNYVNRINKISKEKPELLDKSKVKKIRNHIADRLLSKNKEKWLTIYEAYKKIDDLREKYANNDDKENVKILNELNSYIENIEKKLQ